MYHRRTLEVKELYNKLLVLPRESIARQECCPVFPARGYSAECTQLLPVTCMGGCFCRCRSISTYSTPIATPLFFLILCSVARRQNYDKYGVPAEAFANARPHFCPVQGQHRLSAINAAFSHELGLPLERCVDLGVDRLFPSSGERGFRCCLSLLPYSPVHLDMRCLSWNIPRNLPRGATPDLHCGAQPFPPLHISCVAAFLIRFQAMPVTPPRTTKRT